MVCYIDRDAQGCQGMDQKAMHGSDHLPKHVITGLHEPCSSYSCLRTNWHSTDFVFAVNTHTSMLPTCC